MSPIRSLARPLLAATYVVDGISGLKSPGERVEAVRAAGLSEPEKLVQASSATQLVGGLALATGRLPRLSALALAGAMVPSTYVRHPFWNADEGSKPEQRTLFLKNLSMLGGLLLAAADTGGRESLPHAAARVSRRTQKKAAKAAKKAEKKLHS